MKIIIALCIIGFICASKLSSRINELDSDISSLAYEIDQLKGRR